MFWLFFFSFLQSNVLVKREKSRSDKHTTLTKETSNIIIIQPERSREEEMLMLPTMEPVNSRSVLFFPSRDLLLALALLQKINI